jgi:hypothetical protein
MQPFPTRADGGTVIRLSAIVIGAAFFLSGCSSAEGTRAQELLQQAELAQAQLSSVAFEANVGVVMDGKHMEMALNGAASKDGAALSMRATGIPGAPAKEMRLVVRGSRAWMSDGGAWQSVPVPPQMKKQVNGLSGSMGADAFQELARYVRDVRVAEHQQIGGKLVTTISGELDTAGMLEAVTKLGSLSGPAGEKPALSFDLDDLGLKIGDIEAVLSIDERTHLLDAAMITLSIEAQGKKLEFELRYRLTSANQPVVLPSVPG